MHAGEHAGLESAQPSELHTSCVQYYHVLLVNVTRTTVYKHTPNNEELLRPIPPPPGRARTPLGRATQTPQN